MLTWSVSAVTCNTELNINKLDLPQVSQSDFQEVEKKDVAFGSKSILNQNMISG